MVWWEGGAEVGREGEGGVLVEAGPTVSVGTVSELIRVGSNKIEGGAMGRSGGEDRWSSLMLGEGGF